MTPRLDASTNTLVGDGTGGGSAFLLVVNDAGMQAHGLPRTGKLTIGRSQKCDIVIEDDALSRSHVVLWIFGGEFAIEDLGSRNGTKIGDARLTPGQRAEIAIGSSVSIGNTTLLLQPVPKGQSAAELIAGLQLDAPSSTPNTTLENGAVDNVAPAVRRIAASDINVLVLGETGAGKEVLARSIHELSPRAKLPLLSLNCAALTETLLESELFGHERGAFTGAQAKKEGLLESADGGTVFLDEIGEMPLSVQAKLLRVVELKQVQRLGAMRPRAIDVRFVAATNRDLEGDVTAGRFRQDLLFRLNGVSLVVPPLRERIAEIEPLAELFLQRIAERLHFDRVPVLSTDARGALRVHRWPGNVRELRNVMERAAVLSVDGIITPRELMLDKMKTVDTDAASQRKVLDRRATTMNATAKDEEKKQIVEALGRVNGNQPQAARALGISLRTLLNRMEEYDLPRRRRS